MKNSYLPYLEEDKDAISVFLERRSRRDFVGTLSRDKKSYTFTYSETYRSKNNALAIGPNLPLSKLVHKKTTLFSEFIDRIPSSENQAYRDYCLSQKISPEEKDLFILLKALGKSGPSSFRLEPSFKTIENNIITIVNTFMKDCQLSQKETAIFLNIPINSFQRFLDNKSKDELLYLYLDLTLNHKVNLQKIFSHHRIFLSDEKQQILRSYLES